jgi:hypothetical protein
MYDLTILQKVAPLQIARNENSIDSSSYNRIASWVNARWSHERHGPSWAWKWSQRRRANLRIVLELKRTALERLEVRPVAPTRPHLTMWVISRKGPLDQGLRVIMPKVRIHNQTKGSTLPTGAVIVVRAGATVLGVARMLVPK